MIISVKKLKAAGFRVVLKKLKNENTKELESDECIEIFPSNYLQLESLDLLQEQTGLKNYQMDELIIKIQSSQIWNIISE